MKRIDFEQYLQDFQCVHGQEVKKAIYDFFMDEDEITDFLDLIEGTNGERKYDLFTLLLNRMDFRGFLVTDERISFFTFQKVASVFFVWLFFVLREEYNNFFVEKNYRFLQDLL